LKSGQRDNIFADLLLLDGLRRLSARVDYLLLRATAFALDQTSSIAYAADSPEARDVPNRYAFSLQRDAPR
jgi:hypothetical protein